MGAHALPLPHPGGADRAAVDPASGRRHACLSGWKALASQKDQGWLIVASGNITHNLSDWREANRRVALNTDYAQGFSDWGHQQLINKQVDALLAYRESQPDGERAHPRDEHLLPFFTAL